MCNMCYIRYTSSPPPHNRECLKIQQNRKNFRENRKNVREDRENSMVSEPSSTSEANKFEHQPLSARCAKCIEGWGRKARRDNLSNHTNKSMGFDF